MKKILIANRGEIAARIIKTARKLGYTTVAVFSEPDQHALHVKMADLAVAIKGKTPAESYLSIGKIIDACGRADVDAVHPGYGFLSENPEFAQACSDSGLIFIGPSVNAIRTMGNKSQAKDLMIEAGVPCIPGYQGQEQDLEYLTAKGKEIGFPLMIKAAAGGGGRGLRLAGQSEQLPLLLQSARSEAEKAFGSGDLLLERALTEARHVEIQIVGDQHGNVIHLGERDCSIQRRHQKVFEESPSPAVTESLRQEMGAAAVRAAKAINYAGAGTVEFLLDNDGRYYFLEMNTRLQVEHPVTEMITGIDLVAWQLYVAAGRPLPTRQDEVRFTGHSIEARLYAEDPDDEFRPQVGTILHFRPPSEDFARTDHGLNELDQVSPYYDSMLAKIIATGPDRETARRRLERALADTVILGIKTNRQFLLHCLNHDQFIEARTDTGFIARTWKPALDQALQPDINGVLMAAAVLLSDWSSKHGELAGWSSAGQMRSVMNLSVNDSVAIDVQVEFLKRNTWRITLNNQVKAISLISDDCRGAVLRARPDACQSAQFLIDDVHHKANFVRSGEEVHISSGEFTHVVADISYQPRRAHDTKSDGNVMAPSNGLIASIDVRLGQYIEKGAPVCTVEAMKLIQTVCAPVSGYVTAVLGAAGQQVKQKQLIVQIESEEERQPDQAAIESAKISLVEV